MIRYRKNDGIWHIFVLDHEDALCIPATGVKFGLAQQLFHTPTSENERYGKEPVICTECSHRLSEISRYEMEAAECVE